MWTFVSKLRGPGHSEKPYLDFELDVETGRNLKNITYRN